MNKLIWAELKAIKDSLENKIPFLPDMLGDQDDLETAEMLLVMNIRRLESLIKNLNEPDPSTAEMEKAIRLFCEEEGWANETWKQQPHIAPLFKFNEKVNERSEG